MTIEILDPLVANQIAAGEVIERPASIVKECLENCLDAGATQISIDIERGGVQLIRITDNGSGIAKVDLPKAVARHGTSKVLKVSDLSAIASLGFRGEALASICAVSRVTIASAVEGEIAWQLNAEGTETEILEQPIAHPVGTSVTVRDLFFNVPARRRFLRTEKTEFNHIEEVVRRIALSRFNIAIKLTHNHRQIYQLPLVKDIEAQDRRIQQICGKEFMHAALKINMEATGLKLWGWLAEPNFYRSQLDMQFLYINGRTVRDKLLNHAIRQAYEGSLPRDTFAAFVLFLECDPSTVDVNVHPTKHEVRFHQSRLIHDFVVSALSKVLASNKPSQMDLEPAEVQREESLNPQREYLPTIESDSHAVSPFSNPNKPIHQTTNKIRVEEQQAIYAKLQETEPAAKEISLESMEVMTQTEQVDFLGEPIALIAENFLITKSNNGLGIVNVKKAQRLFFEKAFEKKIITKKPLLFPLTVTLSEKSINLLSKSFTDLKSLGFEMEILGAQQLVLRQSPNFLESLDLASFVTELANTSIETDTLKSKLAACAANHLRPLENKVAQQKLLTSIQKSFSKNEMASCTKSVSSEELTRMV